MTIKARKYTATGSDILDGQDKFTILMGVDENVTGGRIVYQRGAVAPTVEVFTIGNEERPTIIREFIALHCEASVDLSAYKQVQQIAQMQDPQTDHVYHLLEIR